MDELNPYSGIQPRLWKAWNDGFQPGASSPDEDKRDCIPEKYQSDALRYQAWHEEFKTGKEHGDT